MSGCNSLRGDRLENRIRCAATSTVPNDHPREPPQRFHERSKLRQVPHQVDRKSAVRDREVDRSVPEHRKRQIVPVAFHILDVSVPHA